MSWLSSEVTARRWYPVARHLLMELRAVDGGKLTDDDVRQYGVMVADMLGSGRRSGQLQSILERDAVRVADIRRRLAAWRHHEIDLPGIPEDHRPRHRSPSPQPPHRPSDDVLAEAFAGSRFAPSRLRNARSGDQAPAAPAAPVDPGAGLPKAEDEGRVFSLDARRQPEKRAEYPSEPSNTAG